MKLGARDFPFLGCFHQRGGHTLIRVACEDGLHLGGNGRRIGSGRHRGKRKTDAGFRIGFGQAKIRSQGLAEWYQAIEVGALTANDVAQNTGRGKVGAGCSGHAEGDKYQFIGEIAIEREAVRLE